MFIHEAVSAAITNGCRIARSSCSSITIQPTNGPMCCIIYGPEIDRSTPRWNPQADDLLADDWVLVPEK